MLYGKDELADVFERIHNIHELTGTQIVIICAANVDAICTTKILTVIYY